jgi:hypothetical protein
MMRAVAAGALLVLTACPPVPSPVSPVGEYLHCVSDRGKQLGGERGKRLSEDAGSTSPTAYDATSVDQAHDMLARKYSPGDELAIIDACRH